MNNQPPGALAPATTVQPDTLHLLRLLCSMDQSYQSSKSSLWRSLLCWIVSCVLLCLCYYYTQRVLGAWLALVFLIIAFEYKGRFIKNYRKGQAFERAAMLFRGLRQTSDPSLELEYSEDWLLKKTNHYERYFFSKRPQGPRRILEDIAESSYFVKDIAECSHKFFWRAASRLAYSIIFAILGLLALYLNRNQHGFTSHLYRFLNTIVPPQRHKDILEAFLLVLSFITAGEFATLTRQYGYLARKMRHIYDLAVQHLESQTPPDEITAMNVLLEYSALLMESPPLLDRFYKRRKDKLNSSWQGGKGASLAAIPLRNGEKVLEAPALDRSQALSMTETLAYFWRLARGAGLLLRSAVDRYAR